jgi:hypothetical protein
VLIAGVHAQYTSFGPDPVLFGYARTSRVPSAASKIVYVVAMVDAEMWGAAGHNAYVGNSNPHPTIDLRTYAVSPPSTVS